MALIAKQVWYADDSAASLWLERLRRWWDLLMEIGPQYGEVECWVNEVEKLSKITETQPHAAYAAYTHGLSFKWNYLLRITDWEENQLKDILESLKRSIQSHFIPALTGRPPPGKHALPA